MRAPIAYTSKTPFPINTAFLGISVSHQLHYHPDKNKKKSTCCLIPKGRAEQGSTIALPARARVIFN
jgi:hypothetical protein